MYYVSTNCVLKKNFTFVLKRFLEKYKQLELFLVHWKRPFNVGRNYRDVFYIKITGNDRSDPLNTEQCEGTTTQFVQNNKSNDSNWMATKKRGDPDER